MSVLFGSIGFVLGFFVGIGTAVLYLRWKMKRQVGAMQDQMEQMMDMTQGMEKGLGELEDIEAEKVNDKVSKEEKEEN